MRYFYAKKFGGESVVNYSNYLHRTCHLAGAAPSAFRMSPFLVLAELYGKETKSLPITNLKKCSIKKGQQS